MLQLPIDETEARLNLNVTWSDDDTDAKIYYTYTSAKSQIDDYAGGEVDYKNDILGKQLLKDLARYIWNDCRDEFESRFQHEIIKFRNDRMVRLYVSEREVGEGEEDTLSDVQRRCVSHLQAGRCKHSRIQSTAQTKVVQVATVRLQDNRRQAKL